MIYTAAESLDSLIKSTSSALEMRREDAAQSRRHADDCDRDADTLEKTLADLKQLRESMPGAVPTSGIRG